MHGIMQNNLENLFTLTPKKVWIPAMILLKSWTSGPGLQSAW
jgi:hypothetical protein